MIDLLSKIDSTILVLEDMKSSGIKQKILNLDYIDSYLSCLYRLKDQIRGKENLSNDFKLKWNQHMGGVHRFFESTSLEDFLYEIDGEIKKKYW